ncbi:aspartate/glutamate racemase family protein [Aggregatilineales bacterium SYSU G02658]
MSASSRKRLAFLHTVSSNAAVFKALAEELLPDVDVYHIVDESLLQNTIRAGQLQPATTRRLITLIGLAQESGADAVLVTCSSIGSAVELSRAAVDIPVFRVDEPMADEAIRLGQRIGVAATLRTTLDPTAALIRARAAQAQRSDVTVITELCEGAFEAVVAGNTQRHDELVAQGLERLAPQVDVIVLAQASMARAVDALPPESSAQRVPILTSPRSGVMQVATALKG